MADPVTESAPAADTADPALLRRRAVVRAAICHVRDAILADPSAGEKLANGIVFYIYVPRHAEHAACAELASKDLPAFMQRDRVRGLPNLIMRAPAREPHV